MTNYAAFRRQPVPQPLAQQLQTVTLPAPTRGIIQSENEAYMNPGGAIIQDNWAPTLRGCKLRGGTQVHCDLHAGLALTDPARKPVVSAFEYVNALNNHKMFAGQQTVLYDVTGTTPIAVKTGQTDGNYSAAIMANMSGVHLIAVNDTGDPPLHFDGTTWEVFNAGQITGPVGSGVETGTNLTNVFTYRNRMFFIQAGTNNAYFLGTDEYQGVLQEIPLGGAGELGGSLLFGAVWTVNTGTGPDDKACFFTNEGEVLIFSGTNPGDNTQWQQEGRYRIGRPLGKNAHMLVGGDLLILTVDGVVPLSQVFTKDSGQLNLAMPSQPIRPMWRQEVAEKADLPWTIKNWNAYGGIFVTLPGGLPPQRCLIMNNATGAWARFVGYDARCFVSNDDDFYFGTSNGRIMQCERGGTDDGKPYLATLVGGWEMFGAPSNETVWHQARAIFTAAGAQPFVPQLNATIDYQVVVPAPPPAGPDPGVQEVWDQGLWDVAHWDQPTTARPPIRNTRWVSIGKTGFSHAPTVQITISQQVPPDVELLAIAATYERAGVNV